MRHDRDGTELKVGDRVTIEAEIKSIEQGENYCNTTVQTVCVMPPYETGTSLTLNTKQTRKVT